jgi:hypothetical protein
MKSSTVVFPAFVGAVLAQWPRTPAYPDCRNELLAKNKVCDTSLSPVDRAAALVAAMNFDEKLQNIVR